ncbi:MAG: DUF3631 domain-containing protein [Nitrospinae bacterium]|nr:DUF3631 domain-containing protein [Nitrospinota bacterium]
MSKIDIKKLKAAIPIDEYYQSELGPPAKTNSANWTFLCPFHDDKKTPNLVVYREGNYKCFACDAKGGDVLAFHQQRHGLSFPEAFTALAQKHAPELIPDKGNVQPQRIVAEYPYKDESGELLFQVVRYAPKDFKQRRPEGNGGWNWSLDGTRRVPYRLPELIAGGNPVFVPGGEKDVNTLVSHGLESTTNSGGEGNWSSEFNEYLKDQNVVVLEDNDSTGQKHGRVVSQNLHGVAKSIKIIRFPELPKHGDVSDYLENHSPDEFLKLVKDAPEFKGDYLTYFNESLPVQPIPISSKNGNRTIKQIMGDSGFNDLTKDSEPEPIHTAIYKFMAVTGNFDSTRLALAKSEIIKKLNDIKVKGASELVKGAFKKSAIEDDLKQGGVILLEDPEIWDHEVDGAQLLDEITETFKRFLVLPDYGAEAMSLWILHCWSIDAFFISPLFIIESPEKRCGKTTCLNLLGAVGPRPIPASSISAASLFRSVEKFKPFLLIDEADRALKNSEELNCIINASHNRNSAATIRTVGEDHEPRMFSTWCPKAVASIGRLQGTLEDRGIILNMRRKAPGEEVERLRGDRLSDFEPLRQRAFRWAQDNVQRLAGIDPAVPIELHDRAADNWRALLGICDVVGGGWPEIGRKAAIEFSCTDTDDDAGIAIELLSDILEIFEEQNTDRLPTKEMVGHLAALEEKPWSAFGKKEKPISPNQLSRLLKRYKIKSGTIRTSVGTPKGYYKKDFEDSWMRYLPESKRHNATPLQNKGLQGFQNATTDSGVADKTADKDNGNNDVAVWRVDSEGIGGKKESVPDIQESAPLFGAEEEI